MVRHSRARHCAVRLTESNGVVSLEIVDDGEPSGPTLENGSGLQGIRERFAAAGGTVETSVNPAGGFRLLASVPVKRAIVEAAR